jgi:tetratricopeptide (TPR) repeat protein
VVVLKALLIAALAEVLLRVSRRPGQRLWLPAVCTALAILVLSPRLVMQPTCVSFLFLGLTLWVLRYPRIRREQAAPTYRSFWLLPPLFLLWVNFDVWFVLGPILAGLYLAGESLRSRLHPADDPDAPGPGELQSLAIALVVGLAACLVNPFGWHAFTLPEGMWPSAGTEALIKESPINRFFLSPLEGLYFTPYFGVSVAGLAYFLFLLLGVASFLVVALRPGGMRALVGWRLFVWLPLALFSLFSLRTIPFFAIVAGPVIALNLADALRGVVPAGELPLRWRPWVIAGRVLTLLLVAAAVVATVPGWLQALPHSTRRVAWAVHPDASLRQMAEKIHAWHEQGLVPDDTHWLNLWPDVSNYLAWFAPGQRGLLDQRFHLFGPVAADFVAVHKDLGRDDAGPADEAEAGARAAWRRILRKRDVRFVIVPTGDRERDLMAAIPLLSNPAEWAPLYLDGRSAIFGWRSDPAGPDPFAALRLDFRRLAFGAEAEKAPRTAPRAPEERPWWTELWTPPLPSDLDGDAARIHFIHYQVQGPAYHDRHRHQWEALQGASLAACAGGPGGPALNGSLIPLRFAFTYHLHPIGPGEPSQIPAGEVPLMDRWAYTLRDNYSQIQDHGPPESLYLAVRAARRSLAVNPDDPQVHFWLGKAYYNLLRGTREGVHAADLPEVAAIRRTQAAAALTNALKLRPNPLAAQQAHDLLATLFATSHPQRPPYLDLVARHRREQLRIMEETGPPSREAARGFAQQKEFLEKNVEALEREVHRREDQYEVNAANKPLRQKYRIALDSGLAETALNAIRNAPDPTEVLDPARGGGAPLVYAAVELLLDTGQIDEARQVLDPMEEKGDERVMAANLWYQVRRAAAAGDYAEADRYLARTLAVTEAGKDGLSFLMAQPLGLALLREAMPAGGLPWTHWDLPHLLTQRGVVRGLPTLPWQRAVIQATHLGLTSQVQQAEWHLVRGWLALEIGDVDGARESLRAAERLAPPPDRWRQELGSLRYLTERELALALYQIEARQAAARGLAVRCREWLDAAR